MIKVTWKDAEVERIVREAGLKAALAEGERILEESKKEVPYATGTLSRSANVKAVNGEVYIYYNTPYARRQHEEMGWRHPDPTNDISVPGRKPKYLENPFKREKATARKFIELSIRAALKRGGV